MAKANQEIAVNTSSAFNFDMNRKENSCLHREHKLRNYKEKSKHAAIHDQSLHGDFHPLETLVADQNRSSQPTAAAILWKNNELKMKDVKQTGWIYPFNSYATTSVNECRCKPKAAAKKLR